MERINILDLDLAELTELVESLGEKKFRAKQVYSWLAKGHRDFGQMSNVPARLRSSLAELCRIGLPGTARMQRSAASGTTKLLFSFPDRVPLDRVPRDQEPCDRVLCDLELADQASCTGYNCTETNDASQSLSSGDLCTENSTACSLVEAVFMQYSYGNSICISSQVGCRMGCSFCASTMDGLKRNLTAGEMLGEVLEMRNLTGENINHVVIMGMGEPFDNYDQVSKFLRLINSPDGYNLSMRNITVSTCGIIPMIDRFADDFPQVNLAISLHAPNAKMREKIMPVAKAYGYDDLLRACRRYVDKTHRRITFEYSLINGVNDSPENAAELASHLAGWHTHVNLIPLNEVEGREYKTSKVQNVLRFKEILEKKGVAVTVRRTLGSDIDAACGQLRTRSQA